MRGPKITLSRYDEVSIEPDLIVHLSGVQALVIQAIFSAGDAGITTRDMAGYDLRGHLRDLKKKGVRLSHKLEKNTFGQHRRWRLEGSYSLWRGRVETPIKKVRPYDQERTNNPTQNGNFGGSDYDLS